jgi:phosphocarrier protein HPr
VQFRKDFVMDKKYQIRLKATTDVKDFVSAAEKCDFDIDVFYNRVVIDAKSILGVLSLDLTKVLTVQFGGQDSQFESLLKKYAVA